MLPQPKLNFLVLTFSCELFAPIGWQSLPFWAGSARAYGREGCVILVPLNKIRTGHFSAELQSLIYKNDLRYWAESDATFPPVRSRAPRPCNSGISSALVKWLSSRTYARLPSGCFSSGMLQTTPCAPYPSKQQCPTLWITTLRCQCRFHWQTLCSSIVPPRNFIILYQLIPVSKRRR